MSDPHQTCEICGTEVLPAGGEFTLENGVLTYNHSNTVTWEWNE